MSAQSPSDSATDRLEPFAAQLTVTAGAEGISEPVQLIASMLTDIAERCDAAGSSLIGHIKSHVEAATDTGVEVFHCNLTSLRLGARCSGDPGPLSSSGVLEIDLVVLVYGVARQTLEQIVRACCLAQESCTGSTIEMRLQGGHDR